jgi:magnesium chelatase subunit I
VEHFDRGGVLQISDTAATGASWEGLAAVPGLTGALEQAELLGESPAENIAAAELLLEGLAAHRRISRAESGAYGRARVERPKGKGGSGFPFGMDPM